jgi:nucleoside-diphosphate-sugar epimerase
MKKILITGSNSYIGNSFKYWVEDTPEKYIVETISLRDHSWKVKDFSKFDVVLHVAGIAHIKETVANVENYFSINRDLAFEVAKKSKKAGIKQFIFLSTMSVYGIETGLINLDTPPKPKNAYGRSKFQAEELIGNLQDDNYSISIIRPPMIYGKGCKGNYTRLSNLVKNIHFFPNFYNQRSMIYIDNLSEFIRLLIEDNCRGVFFPQNKDYVTTVEIVKGVSETSNKKILFTNVFNPIIKVLINKIPILSKIFGSLVYDKKMSNYYNKDYSVVEFKKSIELTEQN